MWRILISLVGLLAHQASAHGGCLNYTVEDTWYPGYRLRFLYFEALPLRISISPFAQPANKNIPATLLMTTNPSKTRRPGCPSENG